MKDKDEAIREWVAREFNAISQEWVRIAIEHFGYADPLPMWGWMWIVDEYIGRKFWDNSRIMCADVDELRATSRTIRTITAHTSVPNLKKR